MTMVASIEPQSRDSPATPAEVANDSSSHDRRDEEQAFGPSSHLAPTNTSTSAPFLHSSTRQASPADETELTAVGTAASVNYIKRKTSQLLEAISPAAEASDAPLTPKLLALVESFKGSEEARELRDEIAAARVVSRGGASGHQTPSTHTNGNGGELPDVALENQLTRGRQRASWGTQFRILSGRAFKNLYRDPALLAAHYIISIVLAGESHSLTLIRAHTDGEQSFAARSITTSSEFFFAYGMCTGR